MNDDGERGRRVMRNTRRSILLATALTVPSSALGETCTRQDFEIVVEATAEALRDLHQRNRPEMQARLRRLRTVRGWDQARYLGEAAPFVQDEHTAELDARSGELLQQIERMGGEGALAEAPDCARLARLREAMTQLVEVQKSKWAYLLEKVGRELAKQ
jgi:hypothetical protein